MRPTVYTSRPRDSYPARLLRALYSAIIPGVGQLVAGVRRRGFVLLAIFLLVSLVGVIILTRGVDAILAWVVQPKVLLALLWVNIIIMLVRMFAVIDAWMTAKVGTLKPVRPSGPGILMTGVGLALILVFTVAPHAVAGYYTIVSHNLLTTVFAGERWQRHKAFDHDHPSLDQHLRRALPVPRPQRPARARPPPSLSTGAATAA